jgi:ribosome biogenesis GTPase
MELMKDKTSLFAGHSGVGKSSLINLIAPELDLSVKEISEQHIQGKHTTTFAEMFDLDFGAKIIDSPGIKGFGLVDFDNQEIADYFPEISAYQEDCKFNDCLHDKEPKCAVKEAVDADEIPYFRYESYLKILHSEEDNYRKDIHHQK